MKYLVHVLLIITLAFVLYLILRRPPQSPPSPLASLQDTDIPVTWNFDWGGGPGYDRHILLTKRGPYNPGGDDE